MWKQEEQELNKDKPKLVFADPHIPFHHPNYLEFLKATYKKYDCGQVICLGDLGGQPRNIKPPTGNVRKITL